MIVEFSKNILSSVSGSLTCSSASCSVRSSCDAVVLNQSNVVKSSPHTWLRTSKWLHQHHVRRHLEHLDVWNKNTTKWPFNWRQYFLLLRCDDRWHLCGSFSCSVCQQVVFSDLALSEPRRNSSVPGLAGRRPVGAAVGSRPEQRAAVLSQPDDLFALLINLTVWWNGSSSCWVIEILWIFYLWLLCLVSSLDAIGRHRPSSPS